MPARARLNTPPASRQEEIVLDLDGVGAVSVRRVRDRRARRLKLLVSERGARLTVPPGASQGEAMAFLHAHRDWLGNQLLRLRASAPVAPSLVPGLTGHLPLRGEQVPLDWAEGRYVRIDQAASGIRIQLPGSANAGTLGRALREFYLAQARQDIARWLPRHAHGLPRTPSVFRLRPLSSLWGSLSPSGALSLDLALVLGRPSAFEYVLVHELCHLIQPNHSRAFWREVEARFGDWRVERDYLRTEGMALKANLGGLLGAA